MIGRERRKFHSLALPFILILFVIHASGETEATEPFDRLGLIIVSDLYLCEDEVEKGIDLKEYLIQNGADPDHVIFLAPNGTSGADGEPTLEMIGSSFEFIAAQGEWGDIITVYISDHLPPLSQNETVFRFLDGNINLSTVDDWLNCIFCDGLMIYVGGNHSGSAGPILGSEGREIICSMGSNNTAMHDEFSLVRGYESPEADTNNDGVISFGEAYFSEYSREEVQIQGPIFIG